MSAVDYGTQTILFRYKEEADSDKFNKLINNTLITGVYEGLQINKVANNKISIYAGMFIISDGTYSIRVQTAVTTTQDIFCSSTDCYVVARWSYLYAENNYVEFLCTDTPLANDLVLGKLIFSGSTLMSVDYSYRKYGNLHRTKIFIDSTSTSLFLNPETNFWYIGSDGYEISYISISQRTQVGSNLSVAGDYYILFDGSSYTYSLTATGLAYSSAKNGWYDSSNNRVLGKISYDGVTTITISNIYEGLSSGISLDKSTGAEVNTGTDDEKYITPKAIEDSDYIKGSDVPSNETDPVFSAWDKDYNDLINKPTIPVKAAGSELDTGTDDAKFATAKALSDSVEVGKLENEFVKQGLVLEATEAWEGSVVAEQTIIEDSGTYKMWYRGNSGVNSDLGYATSLDMISWTKYGSNPITLPMPSGKTCAYYYYALKVSSTYYIYASCYPGDECYRWSSADGLSWSLDNSGNPVLQVGSGWEANAITNTAVIYDDDEPTYKWQMLYEALGSVFQIGYAYSSDGLSWTKYSGNPVLPAISGTWRHSATGNPDWIKLNGIYYVIYGGINSSGHWVIGISKSIDKINWVDYDLNPLIEATEVYEGSHCADVSIVKNSDGTIHNASGIDYTTYLHYGANQDSIALITLQRLRLWEFLRIYEPIQQLSVATGTEINTGTDDEKYVTPKAISDSNVAVIADIPVKSTGAEIVTGTDDAKFATAKALDDAKVILGGTTVPDNIVLDENTAIIYDSALSADGKYCGIVRNGTAGATLVFGDLIYLDPTDSRWELVDANAASGADGDARGIIGHCVLAAASDGDPTKILLHGVIRADSKFPTFTVNAPVYVSETAGEVVVTQPTTTDVVIRVLGFGLTGDEYYFNPSSDYTTHT